VVLAANTARSPGEPRPGVRGILSPPDHAMGATRVLGDTVEDEVVSVPASTPARADAHRSVDAAGSIPADVPPATVGTSEAGVDQVSWS